MANQDFSMTLLTDRSPEEVYRAINNVRGWWSENIEGDTDRLDAEYLYHYKDVHACRIRIAALVPGSRIVWEVLDNRFSFTRDEEAWKGDRMIFDLSQKGTQTQLVFTQQGLTPADDCYNVCNDAWTGFIGKSLRRLIETGRGEPTPRDRDGAFNEALIEKWNLEDVPKSAGFSYTFTSGKTPEQLFHALLDVRSWWTGLYGEQIEGASGRPGDSFTFKAGGGAHYSRQQLVALVPNEQIAWLVTDSRLTFLQRPGEWTGTKIGFTLSQQGEQTTKVTFFHEGLVPAIECYNGCAGAWTQYLQRLEEKLK